MVPGPLRVNERNTLDRSHTQPRPSSQPSLLGRVHPEKCCLGRLLIGRIPEPLCGFYSWEKTHQSPAQ
ncbi:hypothetical protein UPYG_G00254420 [Umbra pygmaea]|uniref:Uncharacterized protein n=1 Tax=Umbra pygmaea TaxID=75934 RepID=A0ABD0WCP6_UMBPY